MHTLYWGEHPESFTRNLENRIGTGGHTVCLPLSTSREEFRMVLAKHRADLRLVVVDRPAVGDLIELLPLEHLLMGIPVIEILETKEPAMVALGHRFRPRFIGAAADGWSDAMMVVARLLGTDAPGRDRYGAGRMPG